MIHHYFFLFFPEFFLYARMTFPIKQYFAQYDDLNQMREILLRIGPSKFG